MVKLNDSKVKNQAGGPPGGDGARSPYRAAGLVTMAAAALLSGGTYLGDNYEANLTAKVEDRIESTVKKTPWGFKGAVRKKATAVASRRMEEHINETAGRRAAYHAWKLYRAPSEDIMDYHKFYGGMGFTGFLWYMGGVFLDGIKRKRQYK